MKQLLYTLIIIIIISPLTINAIELTLEEAVELALKSDEELQSYIEDLKSVKGQIISSRSSFFPQFQLDTRYTKLNTVPETIIPAGTFPDQPFDMTFPMGTREDFELSISATQPLFTGGKIWHGHKINKTQEKAATEEIRRVENELTYDVRSTYLNLLLTDSLIAVTEESLARAEDHYEVARDRYDVGLAPRFEMLRSEVEVTNLQSELANLKNLRVVQVESLRTLLNLSDEEELILTDTMDFVELDKNLNSCIERAVDNRPEIKSLQYNHEMLKRTISIAKSGYYPDIFLIGSFTSSTDDIDERSHYQNIWSATLQLSWTFFDWLGTYGDVVSARADSRAFEYKKESAVEGIELEVESIYQNLQSASENLRAQEANISLAEESLEMVEDQYDAGLVTNLDVLDAQLSLHRAKLGYYRSLNDYLQNYYDLLRAMGEK